ncbi:MAG: porin family protein, partial [Gammaproteobacteria bacterium]|nr:porin family protein [Gammaproteobacteria bacterium]
NLVLTINSSGINKSRLNLFGQGGIYFADTTLSGPFDSVSKNSNGFLLAAGVEIMLNRHFSLRAEAYHLFDVEDFADDESISSLNLGGHFIF